MSDFDLYIDSTRWHEKDKWETGIPIRAKLRDGGYEAADIGVLEKDSLPAFLRSRGGDNIWAENIVGILLGHGQLHK
ncbi:hypothetical protein NIES592_08320 [Fischerella major NIES-592]|uniref:Uncharacterized protein n=1 Tax=Fischerella major NIES-592 TaxID=210994 RepID=A0A1U7H1J3_9CYAN|nr:hypothetical protein [Fischerella major]OKH14872.1 hypothetical protein NIES592_08320 [Fischerella major NIES-592]